MDGISRKKAFLTIQSCCSMLKLKILSARLLLFASSFVSFGKTVLYSMLFSPLKMNWPLPLVAMRVK